MINARMGEEVVMIEKLIAELGLDLDPKDIRISCGRIRDEYNPKKGGAWVVLRHPALDGDVYVDGDGSTSQVSLLRTALKDLAELVNGEGEW